MVRRGMAFALVHALSAAGCGGESEGEPTDGPTTTTAGTTTTTVGTTTTTVETTTTIAAPTTTEGFNPATASEEEKKALATQQLPG